MSQPVEFPVWWLYISGACFLMSILFNLALVIIALTKVVPLIGELQGQVKRLGDKADGIATTAKSTVETVRARTGRILGEAEGASAEVSTKISSASKLLTAIFLGVRIAGFVKGMAEEKKAKECVK